MMNKRGFTIVELALVVTIMGILLVVGVINLRGSEANGFDSERKADVESIANNLEAFYSSGTDGSTVFGRYPSTLIASSGKTYMQQMLRDIDTRALTAPGVSDPTLTFIPATNNVQTTTGVTPQPTTSQYVYQPLQTDNSLCTLETQECRKYNIYYRLEVDNVIYKITSKRQ